MAKVISVAARQAKRRRHKPGDLTQLLALLWEGVLHGMECLEVGARTKNYDLILRGIHALSQSAGQYARIVMDSDIEKRLKVIEKAMALEALERAMGTGHYESGALASHGSDRGSAGAMEPV